MSKPRQAVADFLLLHGWQQEDSGPRGELWKRGEALAAVPNDLEPGTHSWDTLVVALASAEKLAVRQVVADLEEVLRFRLPEGSTRPRTDSYRRVELDLHLDGPSVRHHETRAFDFGRFVMRSAEAVKELVKSARGVRYQNRSLAVVGGPSEGSVRVILREPDRSAPDSMFPEAPETVEGQALVLLSAMFGAAEDSTESPEAEALRSHLAPLHIGARRGLALLAEAQLDAGWLIHGLVRRGSEESPFRLGLGAALTLQRVAREVFEQHGTEPVAGTLDGWVWSSAELTLITDDRGTIRVSVPMPLQERVAELNSERDTRVSTRLNVYRRVASGTSDTVRIQYSLGSIDRDADQPQLV